MVDARSLFFLSEGGAITTHDTAMEKHAPEKLPIPPLASSSLKKCKHFKSLSTKLEEKRLRDRCRVYVGESFDRWRELRDLKGFTSDQQLAKLLLDSYEKFVRLSSSEKPQKTTSTSPEAPESDQDEKPPLASLILKSAPHILSGPVLKCPACGFSLKVHNGNEPHQPQSIEVTLEMEQTEEPVSGADQSIGESEEEEESEGSAVEQENREEDSDDEWTPRLRRQSEKKKRQDLEEEENEETSHNHAVEETCKAVKVPRREKQLCTECGVFYLKSHKCENKAKPYVCNDCGRRFISEFALKIHSNLHSETHEFFCKYCNKSFKSKVDQLAHEMIHLKQKDPFKCSDCAMTFPTFRKRTAHKRQHTDKTRCKMCGINFIDEQDFMRHVAVHTGERPFKCCECNMSFKQDSHLKSHMRLHTGERPYRCKHCPKAFNHNVSLKSHVKKYHPHEEEEQAEDGRRMVKSKGVRSTGRPKGRPKRNADEKKERAQWDILKRKGDSDDCESEEE